MSDKGFQLTRSRSGGVGAFEGSEGGGGFDPVGVVKNGGVRDPRLHLGLCVFDRFAVG